MVQKERSSVTRVRRKMRHLHGPTANTAQLAVCSNMPAFRNHLRLLIRRPSDF